MSLGIKAGGRFIPIGAFGIIVSGCATTTPPVRVEPQRVEIPVAVACVKRDAIPAEPARTGPLPADARQAADTLAAKAIELRTWGDKLYALLTGCTG